MATTEAISKTRSGKAAWLGDRYWKFGRDEAFQGILQEIFAVDDTGEITSEPLRDSLTNETSGAMILASSGVGTVPRPRWPKFIIASARLPV